MDSAALARQLAELDKVATPLPLRSVADWWEKGGMGVEKGRGGLGEWLRVADFRTAYDGEFFMLTRNNLPAILRALCVMAAVEDMDGRCGEYFAPGFVADVHARADELLAECTGAKS